MNVLILGGTSFTGPHTIQHLVKAGHQVTVFHRSRSSQLADTINQIQGDKAHLAEFADQFRAAKPDVVINMICFTESDAHLFVNTFSGLVSRAVIISSADVYRAYGRLHRTEPGIPDPVPLTEDSPLRGKISIDGENYNKTAVERIVVNASELATTVLRYPAVYGPKDAKNRLYPFLRRMDDGRPTILIEDVMANWRFTHGYVEDVAYATFLATTQEQATGRIYNVGQQDMPPWGEWIRQIGTVAGWTGEVVPLPRQKLPAFLRWDEDFAQDWLLDTTRIRQELGYSERVTSSEALRRTIESERAHPPEHIAPAEFDYAAEDEAQLA
ncbi:NAD-dependent epimerase/dehydratase family protein [Leptolyngbya sp. CCNP1308]|uniref:NAD-dependent epimerase/dehydratase family protein n=1 Tax=Leptolyngbya sp. CCNP1308 TaxID=3110255 RepID=UPI002B20E708|nr:NAD-dependent epimerase/dehydratase family protein [Leptolyngbya sp. CCNP1308]MEA5449517.1 NAD-dependent epimerase/dehydratase family protein [Leptolyngbya sp. CCNP1308]